MIMMFMIKFNKWEGGGERYQMVIFMFDQCNFFPFFDDEEETLRIYHEKVIQIDYKIVINSYSFLLSIVILFHTHGILLTLNLNGSLNLSQGYFKVSLFSPETFTISG